MATATITAPDGTTWNVHYTSSKQRPRTGLGNGGGADVSRYNRGLLRSYADGADVTTCILCGDVVGVANDVRIPMGNGRTARLAGAEADRVVSGLAGWTVNSASGQAPYSPATVAPACRTCNGDESARAPHADRLAGIARDLLDRHAERV